MPLSPSEALKLQRDSDSDDLLWSPIRRFMSLLLMNPEALGTQLGLSGTYTPTDKERELSTLEARNPGRFRSQILAQVYDNIETVLPNQSAASEVMTGLRDGSLHGDLMTALVVFAPKLAEVLIDGEGQNSV